MTVLPSGSHTPAGIDAGLDANGVAQRMRAARRSRYQAFRSRHQPKSTNQSSEVKSTGDRHAANPRCDEGLVSRDVCSTFRPVSIRVSDRLVDQAPESIAPERASRQPSALCWGGAPVVSCPRPPQAFPGREAAPRSSRSEVKRR
jgi:hypothetical protein